MKNSTLNKHSSTYQPEAVRSDGYESIFVCLETFSGKNIQKWCHRKVQISEKTSLGIRFKDFLNDLI